MEKTTWTRNILGGHLTIEKTSLCCPLPGMIEQKNARARWKFSVAMKKGRTVRKRERGTYPRGGGVGDSHIKVTV